VAHPARGAGYHRKPGNEEAVDDDTRYEVPEQTGTWDDADDRPGAWAAFGED
jgi:hypothetical protein